MFMLGASVCRMADIFFLMVNTFRYVSNFLICAKKNVEQIHIKSLKA